MSIYVPTIHVAVTQNIIDASKPNHFGACLIATALRQTGAESIYVSRDVIRFNKRNKDGVMIRYCYVTPARAAFNAIKFDADNQQHGPEYARAHTKPFKFTLQGERGFARVAAKRDRTKGRGPTRNHTPKDVLERRCPRRFHAAAEYEQVRKAA